MLLARRALLPTPPAELYSLTPFTMSCIRKLWASAKAPFKALEVAWAGKEGLI